MPHSLDLEAQFSVSKVKRLLDTVTPARRSDAVFIETVECEIERCFQAPGFTRALMKADPTIWFAAASIKKGHNLIFSCFCAWGMPLERAMTILMILRPSMVVPTTWSKHYIDLFTDICAYHWKAAPLAAQLMTMSNKNKIPAVPLKILFRSAHRKKQLEDILLAMRVHMPEMNVQVEQALQWFLDDIGGYGPYLDRLSMELFAPYIYRASYLHAQGNSEMRQVLWATSLTYESRVALGQMSVAWMECPLAEKLGWRHLADVCNTLNGLSLKLSPQALSAKLAEHSEMNALIKCALTQERINSSNAAEHMPDNLVRLLGRHNYLQTVLEELPWRHLSPVPTEDSEAFNIGLTVDTVI